MGDLLTTTVQYDQGYAVITVAGEIDISSVAQIRERLFELADGGHRLIVDLDQITFIDSTGLGVLVGAGRIAEARGGSLQAVCTRPATRKLLWLTGIDRRIPLFASLEDAVASEGSEPLD